MLHRLQWTFADNKQIQLLQRDSTVIIYWFFLRFVIARFVCMLLLWHTPAFPNCRLDANSSLFASPTRDIHIYFFFNGDDAKILLIFGLARKNSMCVQRNQREWNRKWTANCQLGLDLLFSGFGFRLCNENALLLQYLIFFILALSSN